MSEARPAKGESERPSFVPAAGGRWRCFGRSRRARRQTVRPGVSGVEGSAGKLKRRQPSAWAKASTVFGPCAQQGGKLGDQCVGLGGGLPRGAFENLFDTFENIEPHRTALQGAIKGCPEKAGCQKAGGIGRSPAAAIEREGGEEARLGRRRNILQPGVDRPKNDRQGR